MAAKPRKAKTSMVSKPSKSSHASKGVHKTHSKAKKAA
jgi:hypothetical protein